VPWPIDTVGLDGTNEITEDPVVPTVMFIIPHELMSVEQTVMDDEPDVLAVLKVITEPLMLVCTTAEFGLF
jgi:hypothetical protein